MSIKIAALRRSVLPSLMAACALLGGLGPLEAFAQAAFKPSGPVKIVVMFPPGGGTDAVARIVGERLTDLWQQQVVIEN